MLMTWGCSGYTPTQTQVDDQNPLGYTEEEKKLLQFIDHDFTFQEEEARKHAMDIAASFDRIDGKKRTIKELLTINLPIHKGTLTKGYPKRDSTPEMYIYDFKPDGFAVICADERYVGHIISSPVSSFTHDLHPGYQLVLQGALADITNKREEFYRQFDSVIYTPVFQGMQKKLKAYWEERERDRQSVLSRWMRRLRGWLEVGTPAYAQSTYNEVYRVYGSNFTIRYDGMGWSNYDYRDYRSWTETNVLLRTNFHQDAPYNSKLPYSDNCKSQNGNFLTGCVTTAYAQLLLYYNTTQTRDKIPGLQKLYDYHYKNDNPTYAYHTYYYPNDQLDIISGVLHKKTISDSRYIWIPACEVLFIPINQSIGINLSGSDVINSNWGFVDGEFRGFDGGAVEHSINNKKPVLVRGFSKECILCYATGIYAIHRLLGGNKWPDPFSGHVWLIDGTRYAVTEYKYTSTPSDMYYVTYKGGGSYGSSGGWTMRVSWPTGKPETSVGGTRTLINNELHHNFGWGRSTQPIYTDISTYQNIDWVRMGTFQSSNQNLRDPQNYNISTDVIVNITPR